MNIFCLAILLISISLFLLWFWFFRNRNDSHRVLCALSTSFLSVLLICFEFVIIFLFFLSDSSSNDYSKVAFQRDMWLFNKEIRQDYVYDLKKQGLVRYMTKEEVEMFLGKPNKETPTTFRYYIGHMYNLFGGHNPKYVTIVFVDNIVSEVVLDKI